MNLLVDTQTLLWWREGNRKLGPRTRQAIEGGAASVVVSVVTGWEIAIKSRSGRLRLSASIDVWMPAVLEGGRFDVLDIRMPPLNVNGIKVWRARSHNQIFGVGSRTSSATTVPSGDSRKLAYARSGAGKTVSRP